MTDKTFDIKLTLDAEAVEALDGVTQNLSAAISNLLPPMLGLLAQARRGLFFDLDELEFLASGMQLYEKQGVDTSYGTDSRLFAIIDCLDWAEWDAVHGNRLYQRIHLLLGTVHSNLPISGRTAQLNILALIDGLDRSIQLTDLELGEHPYYLTIDQTLTEIFELESIDD